MRARRSTVLAATVLGASLTLVGCSSSSQDADASKQSAAGSTPSDGPSTSTGDGSAAQGTSELTKATFVSTVADTMADGASYHTTMKTTANGTEAMSAEGDASVKDDDIAMDLTIASQGMDMEIRIVDGTWYMNLGDLTQGKFVKTDPSDGSQDVAESFSDLTAQMDPAASVEALKDAVVSVEKSGDAETIDGVQAQPYDVVVDSSKITGPLAATIEAAGDAIPDTFTYTYWIGSDNKPRKMVMDLAGATTELTMTDWGKKVTVEVPSADELTTMPTS